MTDTKLPACIEELIAAGYGLPGSDTSSYKRETYKAAVAAAREAFEPCEACKGFKQTYHVDEVPRYRKCAACNGTGRKGGF